MQLSKNKLACNQQLTAHFIQYERSIECYMAGGGERVRTDDLLRARQALSQLSYTPDSNVHVPTCLPSAPIYWWA